MLSQCVAARLCFGMRSERIRIIVVDDDPAIPACVAGLSAAAPHLFFCGFARGLRPGRLLIRVARPDVVLLEAALDRSDDLQSLREMRRQFSRVNILVYSNLPEAAYAERVLKAGAFGFVSKSAPATQLIEAIEAASGNEVYLSQNATRRILTRMVQCRNNRGLARLTQRELTVLELLGEQLGVPMIASALGLRPKTIEIYRRRIKDKLGFGTVSDLQDFARMWKA